MKTILLEPLEFDGIQRIAIRCGYDAGQVNYLKKFGGALWSPGERCRHVRHTA